MASMVVNTTASDVDAVGTLQLSTIVVVGLALGLLIGLLILYSLWALRQTWIIARVREWMRMEPDAELDVSANDQKPKQKSK